MKQPEICKMITISTAHITKCDSQLLDKDAFTTCGVAFRLGEGSGYLVHCNEDLDASRFDREAINEVVKENIHLMGETGFSPALVLIQEKAWELGCEYVRLDPDAEELAGLPTYEW